ncbi:MAG: cache domain-containing protein [Nitrospirae bacterium]|nr:cache domain-containing protein [Nitrospirota bacterium]
MFKSRLFIKFFSAIMLLILMFTILYYMLSVPYIKGKVYEIEKTNAKTVMDNVYELIKSSDNGLEAYKDATLQARKEELKNILLIVEQYINSVNREVKEGVISKKAAREKILTQVRNFKFRNNDYIFIIDYNGRMLSNPTYDPKLQGIDQSRLVDVDGKHLLPDMLEIASKKGEGYYSYKWRRVGTATPIDKLSYIKKIPEWDWVMGTGVYIDDIENVVNLREKSIIEDLRRILKKVKLAKTGYIYIFDTNYFNLIHPNKTLENVSAKNFLNPVTRKPLLPEIANVADKPEGFKYKWDKPNDPGHFIYDKISWVRFYKPLGWYICSSVYVDELERSSIILRNRILVVAFTGLLVLIPIGYGLSRKLIGPLRELYITALKVKDGDLTAKSRLKSNDEIGILSDTFNGMIERLRFNIDTLDSKVKERTDELQKAYDELKKLEEMKSSFLSSVSHELRTPLTSVLGFAEIIKESFENIVVPAVNPDNKKVKRAISRISENTGIIISEGERLTSLINDVLDITKMEAGKMVWKCEPINVKDLLKHAARATSSLFRKRDSVMLIIDMEENLPDTLGDYDRIIQVMINLISNAVKFTQEGPITLTAGRQADFLVLSVIDTGIGIPLGQRDEVFEKFKQLGNTLTDKPRGTGLGLPICREIVEHHGGRIWVESSPGEGSTFSFTLPIIKMQIAVNTAKPAPDGNESTGVGKVG